LFLSQILEEYKETNDKDKIFNEFLELLWNSKYTYKKYKKYYTYKVNNELLDNRQNLIDLFNQYNRIEYTVCKSYYKRQLQFIDYIRIHINNMYGYLFDKDVYYKSEYYKLLLTPKKEYFKIVNIKKNNDNIDSINYDDVSDQIVESFKKAEVIKQKSINKKLRMKWKDYRILINTYLRKIFDNYIPVEQYEQEHGWDMRVSVDGWCEDNYIISYFCKSLTGYMRNYINELNGIKRGKKYKECTVCGRLMEDTAPNKNIAYTVRRQYNSSRRKNGIEIKESEKHSILKTIDNKRLD
jgi:predicted nucleic-acid-binding protein